jgi:hypothetical protein
LRSATPPIAVARAAFPITAAAFALKAAIEGDCRETVPTRLPVSSSMMVSLRLSNDVTSAIGMVKSRTARLVDGLLHEVCHGFSLLACMLPGI